MSLASLPPSRGPASRRARVALSVALLAVLGPAACGDDDDDDNGIVRPPTCDEVTSPAVLRGVTLTPDLAGCLDLEGNGARYLVVPQLAAPEPSTEPALGTPPKTASFQLSNSLGAGSVVASVSPPRTRVLRAQARLDGRLRRWEQANAPLAARSRPAAGPRPNLSVARVPAVGEKTTFQVLNTLAATPAFTTVTATVKFAGQNVLLYEDDARPTGGLTDQEYASLGQLFDTKLYPVTVEHFGDASDIDQNQRVVVLLTPVVNRLVTAAECQAEGYVTGFFYGRDLIPSLENSNAAEIFYSIVPDPNGTVSCQHSKNAVREQVPSTFVHEFQHMISFNQHVLRRNGGTEVPWLNEGLSHIAEELVSLVYENDPSQPRSTPDQIFPDSSQAYITGNVSNAYDYLADPTNHSITNFRDYGTIEERGAAWIFLRYVGDRFGDQIFRRLVETNRVGASNLQAQTGTTLQTLLADFAVAIYAANLPEDVRAQLPDAFRFTSRDWQRIFNRFHTIFPKDFPLPYPLVARTLPPGGSVSGTLTLGTQDWYTLTTGSGASAGALQFTGPGGAGLSVTDRPQLTVFRLPNP